MITQQPIDISVLEGDDATFSASFSGTQPLTVGWESSRDGVTWLSMIDPYTASIGRMEIKVQRVTLADSGRSYRTVASNPAGKAVSSAAKLTVRAAEVQPAIVVQPSSANVTATSAASFNVTATGTSLRYQWQVSTDGGKTFQDAPGVANQPTYALDRTDPSLNNNQYRVVVSNTLGAAVSSAVTLVVQPVSMAPLFGTQPQPQALVAGGGASFSVSVTGQPTPTLRWRLGGDFLADGTVASGVCAGTLVSGAVTTNLVLNLVPLSCNGTVVSAVASNGVGTDVISLGAGLTVNPVRVAPVIQSGPSNQNVVTGQSATFSVVATGTGLTYQWRRNGINIVGATSSSYSTPPVDMIADQGALYSVVVSNGDASVTSQTASLTVTGNPDFDLFESLALRGGGEYLLSYNLNFNGAQVPGVHHVSSTQTRLSRSPRDWGAQMVRSGALDSLSATLSSVRFPGVTRRMVNGAIYIYPMESPLLRVSYVPMGVQVDVFSTDGTVVIQSELRSNFSYRTLSGLLGNDNSDFARSYRDLYYLGDRLRLGNAAIFGPDASYLPGAGYLKYSVKSKDDRLIPSDCSGATTTVIPSPCVSNSTLTKALSAGITVAGVTYNSSGGAMRTVLGTQVWVASLPRTPTIRNETVTYRMFFESGGNVYTGWFIADGTGLTGGLTPPDIRAAATADQWQALPFRVELNTQARESLVKAMASGSASAIQVTPSPASFTVSGVAGKMGSGIQQTLNARLSANPTGPVYPVLVASSAAIQAGATAVSQNADGTFAATVTVSPTLAAGTYQGTLTLGLCQEPTCTNRYNVLGGVVNYTINVAP